jgi:hypothetical protein
MFSKQKKISCEYLKAQEQGSGQGMTKINDLSKAYQAIKCLGFVRGAHRQQATSLVSLFTTVRSALTKQCSGVAKATRFLCIRCAQFYTKTAPLLRPADCGVMRK